MVSRSQSRLGSQHLRHRHLRSQVAQVDFANYRRKQLRFQGDAREADSSESAFFAREPPPLPCFLEVLILKDFKSFEPEVLILIDFKSLFSEVLILVGLKPLRINEMREIGNFSEVLILDELDGAKCSNG